MSQRFVLGRENVPCVAEVVNRSLKADCTDFTSWDIMSILGKFSTSGDIMMHVKGYHEYNGGCSAHRGFQYKSKAFMNLLPHMNHDIPR